MARFVIASRRAGKFRESEKRAARRSLEHAFSAISSAVTILADNDPRDASARRVLRVEGDSATVAAMPRDPDVLVEPEILHHRDTYRPPGFLATGELSNFVSGGLSLRRVEAEVVSGAGEPLERALLLLYLRGPGGVRRELKQLSELGRVTFDFPSVLEPAMLVVVPAHGYWPVVLEAPKLRQRIVCPSLPHGPRGWWHDALRIPGAAVGTGVRVGVADTGVASHPALAHVIQAGAFIAGQHLPGAAGNDVEAHGTHVCGLIGARQPARHGFAGLSPQVELVSARVFPPDGGANQADIANAIDALSRTHGADLINLGLGAERASEIERDAIQDALERGTLCICAAANAGGPVQYPAAFSETVAVSALGQLGAAPAGSLSATRIPVDADRFADGNLYLASFSSFGAALDAAGPGVGVISTVPPRGGSESQPFGALDGTSIASTVVCAALAGLLSIDPHYLGLARDMLRAQRARQVLRRSARNIGLSAIYQGEGMPTF